MKNYLIVNSNGMNLGGTASFDTKDDALASLKNWLNSNNSAPVMRSQDGTYYVAQIIEAYSTQVTVDVKLSDQQPTDPTTTPAA